MNPFCIPFAISNMGGAMLAMDVGFMGPNYSISTACATGNYCIMRWEAPAWILLGSSGLAAWNCWHGLKGGGQARTLGSWFGRLDPGLAAYIARIAAGQWVVASAARRSHARTHAAGGRAGRPVAVPRGAVNPVICNDRPLIDRSDPDATD